MKRSLLLFVCAVAITTVSQAQVRFGFKGGANLANITGDMEGTKMKIGFNAGAIVKISVSEIFSVQPELIYSAQGAKIEELDANLNLSYINLPVMAQANISGFIIETGPQLGYLMSAKIKADGESVDIKENLKSIDFAWGIGLGYQMPGSGLGISARYNIGLSGINETEGDEKAKNSVIQLGFHYFLGGRPSKD
jgi:hypothetical protein